MGSPQGIVGAAGFGCLVFFLGFCAAPTFSCWFWAGLSLDPSPRALHRGPLFAACLRWSRGVTGAVARRASRRVRCACCVAPAALFRCMGPTAPVVPNFTGRETVYALSCGLVGLCINGLRGVFPGVSTGKQAKHVKTRQAQFFFWSVTGRETVYAL